jgi:hypothetical protein
MSDREMRSRRLLVACVAVSLLLIAGWSYSVMSSARAEAINANNDLAECRALVDSIEKLNDQPRLVALEASSQTSVSQQVEETVIGVGLRVEALLSVQPRAAERIGTTEYVNQTTRIQVEAVTLRQILQLASDLEAKTAGFRVRDLVLTSNENSSARKELWNAEAVLTQTVFSPTTR